MSDLTYKTDPQPIWDIYPAVESAIRLGEVEAADEREALERAAKKFQQNPGVLTALRRPARAPARSDIAAARDV